MFNVSKQGRIRPTSESDWGNVAGEEGMSEKVQGVRGAQKSIVELVAFQGKK